MLHPYLRSPTQYYIIRLIPPHSAPLRPHYLSSTTSTPVRRSPPCPTRSATHFPRCPVPASRFVFLISLYLLFLVFRISAPRLVTTFPLLIFVISSYDPPLIPDPARTIVFMSHFLSLSVPTTRLSSINARDLYHVTTVRISNLIPTLLHLLFDLSV